MLLLHQSISPSQIIVFHQNLHQKKIKSRQSWAADPKNFPTNGPRFKKTYRTSYRARQSTTTTAVLSPSGHHITFTTYRGYPFKTLASCALGPGYALAETPRYHRSPAEIERGNTAKKERIDPAVGQIIFLSSPQNCLQFSFLRVFGIRVAFAYYTEHGPARGRIFWGGKREKEDRASRPAALWRRRRYPRGFACALEDRSR